MSFAKIFQNRSSTEHLRTTVSNSSYEKIRDSLHQTSRVKECFVENGKHKLLKKLAFGKSYSKISLLGSQITASLAIGTRSHNSCYDLENKKSVPKMFFKQMLTYWFLRTANVLEVRLLTSLVSLAKWFVYGVSRCGFESRRRH